MKRKRRGPGRDYREGISLVQLIEMFPDDEAARKWFEERLWPNGPRCPRCRSKNVTTVKGHRSQTHRCRDCKGRPLFCVRTGTVMASTKLGYREWVIALYLFVTNLKGTSSMHLHRDLGIGQLAAWHLGHRIREAWSGDDTPPFDGEVEADETHMGGKRRWMHAERSGPLLDLYGRGFGSMTTVAGVRERDTGRIHARVVPASNKKTLHGFVHQVTAPGSTLYTDEAGGYMGVEREHKTVNHKVGQYVDGQASTNGLESFWSQLKRGYHGTFHYLSAKHLDRYVSEFAGRHNNREADTLDMMGALAASMAGKRLRWKDLVDGERVLHYHQRIRREALAAPTRKRKKGAEGSTAEIYQLAASPPE